MVQGMSEAQLETMIRDKYVAFRYGEDDSQKEEDFLGLTHVPSEPTKLNLKWSPQEGEVKAVGGLTPPPAGPVEGLVEYGEWWTGGEPLY